MNTTENRVKISPEDKKRFFEIVGYKPNPPFDKKHPNWDLCEKYDVGEIPGMWDWHNSPARFKSIAAGSRYGKSYAAAMEVCPIILYPKTRGWIVAPSFELGEKEFAYVWDAIVVKLGLNPITKSYDVRSGRMRFSLVNGSKVQVKSIRNPEDLLGEEIDWVILSEASQMQEIIWQRYIRQRVIDRGGVVIVPFTPHGNNWIKGTFYNPLLEDKDSLYSVMYPACARLSYPRDEWKRAERELPESVFEEQYLGRFISFSGQVYSDFSAMHKIEPFEIPSYCSRYVAIDTHPNAPTAALWMAVFPDGRKVLYDELLIPDKTVPEIAEILRAKEAGTKIISRYIDARSANVRNTILGTKSVNLQFAGEGFYFLPGDGNFDTAYQSIIKDLRCTIKVDNKNAPYEEKIPVLTVFKNLTHTIDALEGSVWESYLSSRKERDPSQRPLNVKQHLPDCLKYIYNAGARFIEPSFTKRREERDKRESRRKVFSYVGGY